MLLRPTYTDQKFDSHLLDKSQTRWVLGCMSLRSTPPRQETLKICMDARKTRRGLDENGHIYRKPGEDWRKMAISTENPAGIGWIWPYPPKTRRGLEEYGHIYRKPGGDWMKMAISTENPAGIGFNMNTAIESLPGIGFHTFLGITFWARIGFMYPHAGYTYSI